MSADAQTRKTPAQMPPLTFAGTAFTKPPALKEAKVAIVTTAALLADGQRDWLQGEETFRVLERGQRNLRMAHWSLNYDRTGFVSDLNVVFPIDRLEELAKDGVIGGVGPRHLAFMGALHDTLSTIRLDTGPAAAKMLRDDGVSVVVLTGV
ncbi:MAG: glycine/sarcosine/betaine reductase selenoprotein B family protein [Vulcanimicrobiaceae bacterium]